MAKSKAAKDLDAAVKALKAGLPGWADTTAAGMVTMTRPDRQRRVVVDVEGRQVKVERRVGGTRWRFAIRWHTDPKYQGKGGLVALCADAITLVMSSR